MSLPQAGQLYAGLLKGDLTDLLRLPPCLARAAAASSSGNASSQTLRGVDIVVADPSMMLTLGASGSKVAWLSSLPRGVYCSATGIPPSMAFMMLS